MYPPASTEDRSSPANPSPLMAECMNLTTMPPGWPQRPWFFQSWVEFGWLRFLDEGTNTAKNLNLGRGCLLFKKNLFHCHRLFCSFRNNDLIHQAGQKCGFLSAAPSWLPTSVEKQCPLTKGGSWNRACKQHHVTERRKHAM